MDSSIEFINRQLVLTSDLLVATTQTHNGSAAASIAEVIYESMKAGGKLLLAGNGGSAADAQHIAAEFVNYFSFPRQALPALALTTDTSVITSISNDSSFDFLFSRQIQALGKTGDVVWLYSTSGTSRNIIEAASTAKLMGLSVVIFTGSNTSALADYADFIISVPSDQTPKIQEVHLVLGHAISAIVENRFFGTNE